MQLVTLVDYFGTVVFAFSGALAGGHKRMDIFGVAMVGLVTAVGGGSLRDVLIGALPVFWVQEPVYLLVAMVGVVLALGLFGLLEPSESPHHLLVLADAVGLAAFTMIGARKALLFEAHAAVAVLLGTFTAVMGGVFRDLLSGQMPLILRREVYATACVLGAVLFVALRELQVGVGPAMLAGGGLTFVTRMVAVHYHMSLPRMTNPD